MVSSLPPFPDMKCFVLDCSLCT
uniref:Uncharacterized protein n=1 Tax=Arundo donax TaxID=35708 RepID=A0A0A9B6D8_ARUDO